MDTAKGSPTNKRASVGRQAHGGLEIKAVVRSVKIASDKVWGASFEVSLRRSGTLVRCRRGDAVVGGGGDQRCKAPRDRDGTTRNPRGSVESCVPGKQDSTSMADRVT